MFLDDEDDEVCSFYDDEHIRDMDKQAMIMLWGQIKLFFHRIRINDLTYEGHTLNSSEVIAIDREIEKIALADATAQAQYRESQRTINAGGQI